jgi:hypothetical protein
MNRATNGRRLLSVGCLAVVAAHIIFFVRPAALNTETGGFAAYYTASRLLLQDARDVPRVYDDEWFQSRMDGFGLHHVRDIFNVQPPTMTLIMTPVAWLAPRPARIAWTVLTTAFWIVACALLYRSLFRPRATIPSFLLLVAATTVYVPLRDNFRYAQCYGLLLLLLTLHLQLLLVRKPGASWAAGIPLGCMLILKSAAVWLWPLLLFSRQWRTLIAAAATGLGLALFLSPFVPWPAWHAYFHLLPQLASDPVRYVSAYQTVPGFFGHLFVHDETFNGHPVAHLPRLASLATVVVTAAALVQSVRDQRMSGSFALRALSLGMFGALIVTLAPVAESHHYLLVLPSIIIAWWWALTTRASLPSWGIVLTGTLLLSVPQRVYSMPSIQGGWLALFAYPRVYGAFVLWGWLGRALKNCQS